MVDVIRNWLLGIVKQAIREVEREEIPVMNPQLSEVVNSSYAELQKGAIPKGYGTWQPGMPRWGGNYKAADKRAVPRYDEPVSFEDEQNQALKAQDEFWAKKVPSDV